MNNEEIDLSVAIQLQAQFDEELRVRLIRESDDAVKLLEITGFKYSNKNKNLPEPEQNKLAVSLIDPSWELLDPTPDIRALFLVFNDQFFWGRLLAVEVKWSPRMTVCAGICSYQGRGGLCSVRLSTPLLKLRPRKDLVETLLHEMIHAYLFVTHNNTDHDGHGPNFHRHMYRINKLAETNITVYHRFHNEVAIYKQHVWLCDGPCKKRPPYHGLVKRSMNRAPGPNDLWWPEHYRTCGGSYTKIKEPEGFGQKKRKLRDVEGSKGKEDIRNFFPLNKKPDENIVKPNFKTFDSASNVMTKSIGVQNAAASNVHGFGGTQNALSSSSSNRGIGVKRGGRGGIDSGISRSGGTRNGSGRSEGTEVSGMGGGDTTRVRGRGGGKSGGTQVSGRGGGRNSGRGSTRGGSTAVRTASSGSKTLVVKSGKVDPSPTPPVTECNLTKPFSGGGHTLGGGDGASCNGKSRLLSLDNSNNNKKSRLLSLDNSNNNNQNNSNELDTNLNSPKEDELKCPMCENSIKENDFNNHIADCVGSDFYDDDPFDDFEAPDKNISASIIISSDEDDINERKRNNLCECPICRKKFSSSDIDKHANSHFV